MIQNLANEHSFQGKESYMEPMNAFLKNTKSLIDNYFSSLIDVGEPADTLGYLDFEAPSAQSYRAVVMFPSHLTELVKLLAVVQTKKVFFFLKINC